VTRHRPAGLGTAARGAARARGDRPLEAERRQL